MDIKNEITTAEEYHAEVHRLQEQLEALPPSRTIKRTEIRVHLEKLYIHITNPDVLRIHLQYLIENGSKYIMFNCYEYFLIKRDVRYLRQFIGVMNIEEFFGSTAMVRCKLNDIISDGVMDVLEVLIEEHGLPVNYLLDGGRTMLMHASLHKQRTVFDYLLHKGIDPNTLTVRGNSVLINVVRQCDIGYLDTLIVHGVNLFVVFPDGRTVFHHVMIDGDYEMIKRIYDMGIPFDLENCMKLFISARCVDNDFNKCKKSLRLLRELGAKEIDVERHFFYTENTRRRVREFLQQ